jgi:hypothetical protein
MTRGATHATTCRSRSAGILQNGTAALQFKSCKLSVAGINSGEPNRDKTGDGDATKLKGKYRETKSNRKQ